VSVSELNSKNYRRIFIVNMLLCVPLLVLFAWPYLIFSHLLHMNTLLAWTGALLFSIPFMLTILHGYVTMAVGSGHRHYFYDWLMDHPFTYGLLFTPLLRSTRFRLTLFALSLLLLLSSAIFMVTAGA